MARRLPSLNALRAFEAAARHMSFTRAADELCVTQGAVSRQVKALEAYLEVQLFRRLNRTLIITEEGQAYMGPLGKAFNIIDNATVRLANYSDEGLLNVRVLPTLAMRWLIPRLHEFQLVHPLIEVRITTSLRPGDGTRQDVDIVFGRKPDRTPEMRFDKVVDENLIVVCSPALLNGDHPLNSPRDLVHHTFLHAMTREEAWQVWLNAVGKKSIDPSTGSKFEHYYFALQAAVGGLGIAVAPWLLVKDDLEFGRLIAPFDIAVPSNDAYFLIYTEGRADVPKVKLFRDWVLQAAETERALSEESERHPKAMMS